MKLINNHFNNLPMNVSGPDLLLEPHLTISIRTCWMFAQLSWRWTCQHHVSQICSFSHMFEPVGFPERQIEPLLQSVLQQEKPNVGFTVLNVRMWCWRDAAVWTLSLHFETSSGRVSVKGLTGFCSHVQMCWEVRFHPEKLFQIRCIRCM